MHFTHFSNALHTFLFHLTSRLLYLYTVFLHYITHTYTQHAHIYPIIFIQGFVKHFFLKQCGIFLGIAFSSSIALHFFFKGCIGYFYFLSSVCGVDLHCIFFPWTWSFFSFHFGVLVSCFVAVVVLLFDWSFERK